MLTIAIEKLPNETDLDFHKRIVYGKLVDKTLADYDYTELAELIYGKAYSSDVARRMLYGSRKTLELIDQSNIDNITDSDIASDIDDKIVELKKERQKFYDQRREYNKLVNSDGRLEHLYSVLENAAQQLNETVGDIYKDMPSTPSFTFSNNEAVLVFSDWHYGMITDNIYNKFNTEICRLRVKHVVEEAIKRIVLHGCNTLHVVVLGDILQGGIHASSRVASEELVCDQLMQASEILAQSIQELSRYVEDTNVYTTYGNHARTIQNKKDNIHADNMERIVEWWLKERFKDNDSINIVESENDFLIVKSCGHYMCASHGDLDDVKSSPKLLSTLFRKQLGIDVEYILLGDKHHGESFNEIGITSMICGSLCGTDEYANNKRLYSEPEQLLLITNEEDGVDAVYRISCV